MLPRSKLEIMIEYSQFLLASLEDNFCMNLSYQVGIVHYVNRSRAYDRCCNTVLSYSDICVGSGTTNCILITQMRLKCVGPLLPFEDFMSVFLSPGEVTGPSQCESSGGAATLMPLDLHAFL